MQQTLSSQDRRTLILASLGGALEFYDFIIFVFFAAVIADIFFPPDIPDWLRQLQAFGIFAAGYLARPLGGVIMAHFGDLFGRKRMFMISVLLMAVPTLLIGLLPTYSSIGIAAPVLLLVMRVLQGAAVGGEVPGAWVFVAEHVPPHRIGFACGVLTCGLTVGILLGSLMATGVNTAWTATEIAEGVWRLPFIVGGIFGLAALWLRRYLHETPVFEQLRARRALTQGLPIREVLAGHRDGVIRSMILTWLLTAGIVVVILMTPTLAQTIYKMSAQDALIANCLATLALSVGCVAFGSAADRFGTDRTLTIGAVSMLISAPILYWSLNHAPQYFTLAYMVAGFCVGTVGAVPTAMVTAFPPAIRFSGVSFSYNLAYALAGGFTPLVVTLWIRSSPHAPAYYVSAVSLIAVIMLLPGLMRSAAATSRA
ncbi:MAG TPA: MFS transporter [Povalibacter sp.]|nr:MFS transporter [Povalibacter sp.]